MTPLRPATDDDSAGVIALIARVFAEYPGCVLDVDREEPELRAPASSFDRFWVVEENEEGSRSWHFAASAISRFESEAELPNRIM